MLVAGLMIGKSTQRHTGSAGVRVDPKGEPGEDDDKQGRRIHTHHVEAHLPPQSKNHLHTRVVAYHTTVQKVALNRQAVHLLWNLIFQLDQSESLCAHLVPFMESEKLLPVPA